MSGYNTTDANDATATVTIYFDSGWLSGAALQLYTQYAIVLIAIFGATANALVLYALILYNARDTKKRMVNWLIINQNVLDLSCCFIIIIGVCIKLSIPYFTGMLGYILCSVFFGGNAVYCLFNATVINLMALTIERYLKVVYPFWSKKNLKSWMIYATIVFSWIGGVASAFAVGFLTSIVDNGICYAYDMYWSKPEFKLGYGVWHFVSFTIIPLIIFVYCYGHIVVVMRKQMRVMAGHSGQGTTAAQNASQTQSKRIKWNIIKTMIIVSAFFIACWCPNKIYTVAADGVYTMDLGIIYMVTLFLPYINISLNPFIYATKHNGVRSILARMMSCRKDSDVATTNQTQKTDTNTKRNAAT